ncbi:ABC-2 type transport system permease protein [Nonomuraea jabiensis]|uniref:ABC-2 type transport system permease protein n=1 Tax=Nonomuraea jabiensis TaxID=882448 RepID=A0A7W9G587_9ACTN|nr:ABC-2 type transport system permease protein [Nonomuraea jabiensis]
MTTVALFAQLKLQLLGGNLRGDLQRKLGFVFTLLIATGLALLGFFLMSLLRLAPHDLAADLVIVAFTAFLIGWMIVPLMAFGLDDTLDPAKLSLLPLRTGQLAVGMFTASVTGVWPLAMLIITAGALVGVATGVGGVLLGVPAVLLQFALCVVTSRLITTSLSSALRTRRGRDVLAVAALLVVVLAQLPNLVMNRGLGDPEGMLRQLAGVLRWTPPGMAAHAMADGGLAGLAELALVAVIVVVLGWLWIKALGRALVTPDVSTQAASVRKESGLVDRFLPDGPLAAVVTKELKYIRREPRFRVGWFSAVVVTAVLAFSLSRSAGGAEGVPIVLTCVGALMIALQSGNTFGIDGRSLWMNAVAFGSERGLATDLAGRHLANALIAVPLLTVIAVATGLFTGHPGMIVPAALAGWGALGLGLGVGSVMSVVVPYTVPERMNAFSGAAPGQGGQAFASAMGGTLGIALLSLPFVVPLAFGWFWVCAVAPFYGVLAETLGRRLAARIGFARMPELLGAVSKGS